MKLHKDRSVWGAALWKGTRGSLWTTSSIWVNGVLLWQRKPTECWPASTHTSPAGMKKSLSCPTRSFSGHTWNTAFTFGPCYTKKMWTGCRGSREGPQKRKGWDKCLFSLEIRRLRGDLTTVSQYLKDGYKEDGDCLFIQGVTGKRGEAMDTCYSWGHSNWT